MADTKASGQSIRRAARQAAIAAQAKRRAQAAERDKRLDAAVLALIVALRERDALEQLAGAAIRSMIAEGLTVAEIVTWTDGQTTAKEAARLANLQPEGDPRDRHHQRREPAPRRPLPGRLRRPG